MGKKRKQSTKEDEPNGDESMQTSQLNDDESLIDFLIDNDRSDGQIDLNEVRSNSVLSSAESEAGEEDSDEEDAENRYDGRVLNRKEQFEQIYLKYAKDLYSEKSQKIAKSLRKKIKVVLGEGQNKRLVFVDDEPYEIEQRVQLDHKEIIALQLTKTRVGFSYFCAYHDSRFNRICFQPFKDKKEVVDHYYSLHLNKLKNYYCNDENCRKSFVFHKQMKGHLIRRHGIYSDFEKHLTAISYYFESRCQVKSIKGSEYVWLTILFSIMMIKQITIQLTDHSLFRLVR